MKILVCGGAGYIGSHTVAALLEEGHHVVVLDNLGTGHMESVQADVTRDAKFYFGDLHNPAVLQQIFRENPIDAVIDFAAFSLVGESVVEPHKYFDNNIGGTLTLLSQMRAHGVKNIVFSSTAAVYGEPENIPILESDRTCPTNPYGDSKLMVEKILHWFDSAYGIKYIALRYFNAAGAHISGQIGEDHHPESHLLPIILQTALGKRNAIEIYGDDYPTADGTCIRDYIHVSDLADAHILAVKSLLQGGSSGSYNLGNGKGFSVKQVVEAARRVTGLEIKANIAPRRAGDPSVLIASSEKMISTLHWKPRYNQLEKIIETAWKWHQSHPDGYRG